MNEFLEVLRFELTYRRRHAPLYIFFSVCFLFAFLCMAIRGGMRLFGGEGLVAINAPEPLHHLTLVSCLLFGLVITTAFVSPAVIRDDEFGAQSLFFTTPLRKIPYLLGRFSGGILASFLMFSGIAAGAWFGSLMPWQDPERLVEFTVTPYLYALFVLAFPNLFFVGAIAFSVATLSRRLMYSYVAILGLIVINIVAGNFISDLDNDLIAGISDPFAMRAYRLATRYFTTVESNTVAAPYVRELVINRVLWGSVGVVILLGTLARYRMALPVSARWRGRSAEYSSVEREPIVPTMPTVTLDFGWQAHLSQIWFQTRNEVRGLVRSAPFLVIALFGIGNIVGGAVSMIHRGGTTTLPVTHLMIGVVAAGMALFMLIVLIFYAGELVHRERRYRVAELYDALPISNWVPLLSKLLAMVVGMIILLVLAATTTIAFQVVKGYLNLELGIYVFDIGAIQIAPWFILSVAAIGAQVVANHKFLGYLLMVLVFVVQEALPGMDFEHNLYIFGGLPGVIYSDMNGYGHFLSPRFVFSAYWSAFCLFLLILAELLWVRGNEDTWRKRLQIARRRCNVPRIVALAAAAGIWLGLGVFIFYNTNVLNTYLPTDEREELQARYEREYKKYEGMSQPRITKVSVNADLFPEERSLTIRGKMIARNKSTNPIAELHLMRDGMDGDIVALDVPGATLRHFDKDLDYRIYDFTSPLAVDAEITIGFEIQRSFRGFANESTDNSLVANGTFFNNRAILPQIGYLRAAEISDANKRRNYDLPSRERMPKIDNLAERKNTYIASDSDWIEFEAEISTSPNQIAVAPGYLVKDWLDDGRRHFKYVMDSKILNFWSILSADYQVRRDSWRSATGKDVAIEVFYDRAHPYNVEKMVLAVKESLDYFSSNFSPYQHRQVRILEFPRYAAFAQSFPNTIPYSESLGFIADGSDEEAIDYVHYVTSHEVAHQWWAHQVIGANVQGCTMLSETLAQYSALMVMQKHYGPQKMPKFLEYELDRYLAGRSSEDIAEMPLLLVENQQYIHYNKGSLVMFALAQYIGEERVNEALRNYLQQVGFQEPPFTVSTELYAHLQAVTPEKFRGFLSDLFEKITLFDIRTRGVRVAKRSDGKYEITLSVQVKKYYADGKGVELPVDSLNDWIEVGVYAKDDATDLRNDPRPIYLERHLITASESEITVTVDEEPGGAGIDPRHLLIDRAPDDNRKGIREGEAL
jgi:hypothetical protein